MTARGKKTSKGPVRRIGIFADLKIKAIQSLKMEPKNQKSQIFLSSILSFVCIITLSSACAKNKTKQNKTKQNGSHNFIINSIGYNLKSLYRRRNRKI